MHDSEELGFINNRTPESCLTLEHAAGSHDVPESDYGFMIGKKNQETGDGRAAGVSECVDNQAPLRAWLC